MKINIALLLSLIVISCSPTRENKNSENIMNSLTEIEKELYTNPSIALDSLLVYKNKSLTNSSRTYLNLLCAIAYEQKFGVFKNDSIIKKNAQLFKENRDNFNYSRALLYSAIAQYYNKNIDSEAYNYIGEAETLFKKTKTLDYNLGATLYLYLGRFHRFNSNHEKALQSIEKSLEYSSKANNRNSLLIASLELFNLKLINKKYGEAINSISCFGEETKLPAHIEYGFNNAMYNFYSAKKDPVIAIEYLKKILQINPQELKINTNRARTYYQLASLYKRINMNDSSLYYAQTAVHYIADSITPDSHFYYSYLADILYQNKQYIESSALYKQAHLSYIYTFTKFSQQREIELKAKFNFEEQERERILLNNQRALILNILYILTALLVLISLSYYFYVLRNKEITSRLSQELELLNRDLKKNWLFSEIYKSTSYILPKLIDNVYQESLRSRKISNEIFESLNKIIDTANSTSRSSLTEITNHEQFIHIFENASNLDSLTDFEKLVYALNEEGYSNSEIANFLNSSEASIRTIKGKISRKMHKTEADNNVEN